MPRKTSASMVIERIIQELDENKELTQDQRLKLFECASRIEWKKSTRELRRMKERYDKKKAKKLGLKRGPGRPRKDKPFTPTPSGGLAGFLEATSGKEAETEIGNKTPGSADGGGEAPRGEQAAGSGEGIALE